MVDGDVTRKYERERWRRERARMMAEDEMTVIVLFDIWIPYISRQ